MELDFGPAPFIGRLNERLWSFAYDEFHAVILMGRRSMQKRQKEKYNLVCVAHPDDETLFFGGLIQKRRSLPWKVICMTDGNAGGKGTARKRDFARACRALGVKEFEWWSYPDIYDKRLPVDMIALRLSALPVPHEIYTHGPLGEYGHPHHQDVSFAAHLGFRDHPRLYSVAYNTHPELRVNLSEREFENKARTLTKIYGSETSRFLHLLPATHCEGFVRVDISEARALYAFLSGTAELKVKALARYRALAGFLASSSQYKGLARPF